MPILLCHGSRAWFGSKACCGRMLALQVDDDVSSLKGKRIVMRLRAKLDRCSTLIGTHGRSDFTRRQLMFYDNSSIDLAGANAASQDRDQDCDKQPALGAHIPIHRRFKREL
ncbi:MAG: hypothetical protein ACR2NN_18245 [Bryobacteraceae bacterium]